MPPHAPALTHLEMIAGVAIDVRDGVRRTDDPSGPLTAG